MFGGSSKDNNNNNNNNNKVFLQPLENLISLHYYIEKIN